VVSAKDQAQRAQQQAEEASDAKSRFLANVSHELRTPLHGIMGMSNLMSRTPLSDEQAKVLGLLKTSAAQLFRVLSDLLDMTRVASGKLSIRAQEFSLAEFLEWLEPILRSLVEERGLEFVFNATGTNRVLRADRERIAQIILNLTGNAAQYTEQGSVTVSVSCATALTIRVADTGTGIPASEQERIFAPFAQYQAGDPLRTHSAGHGPGLGLGLAIVRSLTELLGGTIDLDSAPQRGTTFGVEIPVQTTATKRQLTASRSTAGAAAQTGPARRDGLVLIVEDQAINRLYLARLFQPYGWRIHESESGEGAMALVKQHRYDLVFMDVGLPDMDGRDTARLVRAWERDAGAERTPIVALTAHAYQEDRDRCAAVGMDGFLAKPFDEAGLWAEVNRLCPAADSLFTAGNGRREPEGR
jgi:CheY-like chemotaxis protein/nitrogen-specific signal transduction histidine kinase